MKHMIWLTYDLGIRGDYEGLHAWLDEHDAKECGDRVALVKYDAKRDVVKELKKDLSDAFTSDRRTRIYLIYLDNATKKLKGTFLFGRRRDAPWKGRASGVGEVDEEDV